MSNYVTVHYRKYNDALEWAKKYCPGYITNDYHQCGPDEFSPSYYDFFFSLNTEEDMTAFKLHWGTECIEYR